MWVFRRRLFSQHALRLIVRHGTGGIFLASLLATLSIFAGCQLTQGRIIDSPLSFTEQSDAILEIVPIGTPHGEAIERLEAAGIEGTSSARRSIFYCDLWNRKDGTRWELNVALLFDEKNRLYKTRHSEAETGVYIPDDTPTQSPTTADLPK